MARVKSTITRTDLKQDTFILKLFEWGEFAKNNLQTVIIVGLVIIVSVVAGVVYSYYQSSQTEEAGRILAPGLTAAAQYRYADAIPIFERVKTNYRGSNAGMDALSGLANALFQTGKTEDARRSFQEYLDTYGGKDDLTDIGAKSGLAACDEQSGKPAEAAKQFEALATEHPQAFLAPRLLLNAARSYRAANQPESARKLYTLIIEKYKKSATYVREAKSGLADL